MKTGNSYMTSMMTRLKKIAYAVAAATLVIGVVPAAAQTSPPIVVTPRLSNGDIQNLQNRQQRLDYQRQQQFNRDLNNLEMRQRQPRIEVPVMKPTCSPQNSGIRC